MEKGPGLVGFGRGQTLRAGSLHPILAKEQAKVINSAFNFVSVAFCLNDGHANSAKECGLNRGVNRENGDFCL